jgi:hypothetical protein
MSHDKWQALWEIATGEDTDPAVIHVDDEDSLSVVLEWSDGSQAGLHWHDGDWRFAEGLCMCPGDAAARDAL